MLKRDRKSSKAAMRGRTRKDSVTATACEKPEATDQLGRHGTGITKKAGAGEPFHSTALAIALALTNFFSALRGKVPMAISMPGCAFQNETQRVRSVLAPANIHRLDMGSSDVHAAVRY